MNRLKKTLKTGIIILLSVLSAHAQDYILKVNSGYATYRCSDLSLNDGIVRYTDAEDGNTFEISIDDVFSINFHEDRPHEINVFAFELDTIRHRLDSFSSDMVYYRLENNLLQSVKKSEVFAIVFRDTLLPDFSSYQRIFFQLYKQTFGVKPKLFKRDGSQQDFSELVSINNGRVEMRMLVRGNMLLTSADISLLSSITIRESVPTRSLDTRNSYFLSSQGKFIQANDLKVKVDTINSVVIVAGKPQVVHQLKTGVYGLFFHDFSMHKEQIDRGIYPIKGEQEAPYSVLVDFNGGIGYLVGRASSELSKEQRKYLNELRAGFAIDANIKIQVTPEYGIGAKYNRYSTSNSILSIAEDNITVSFIGASFYGVTPIPDSGGSFFSSISLGTLSYLNRAKLLGQSLKIEGQTLGMYLSSGVDFVLTEGLILGIQAGYLMGGLKSIKINGNKETLQTQETLNRLDGMVGVKLYF